ncbi:polyhydroxyalkanoate depolymerase [Trinickia caryophylli]|uniref:Polyhydroxyalkanoate depolymerase, intracellular n=1 Tax=Trinickia caryophylli TaxID=28094 RepID=A0A1X7H4L0_TRICW|nr:polyhydroxyalkanoate depolymerase [Trinickia caryophylli]WQE11989.1 polyhydroxyalkanoate depolymerase [Trinickia caryophylli]GLU35618.1 esterase [Trinickia caryophylli]SMF79679.1 polyhydroxyalkanoate depolymerase, intracellular [Trinickia caryophylli]
MLYDWLEAQRALARAAGVWSACVGQLCGLPARTDEPVGLPGYGWLWRFFQRPPAPPPFGITCISNGRERIAIDETVVERTPFCALRLFSRRQPGAAPADSPHDAIFLCAPLAGHHAVMLRETVETLLQESDVYVTDWADARDVPLADGAFGLDDYVLTLERFMLRAGPRRLHVIAVCQATAPTLAAAALLAARGEPAPLSLTLMGGPIDTRFNPTSIDRLATAHDVEWFRWAVIDTVPSGYRGAGRRVYPGYLQHAAIVAAHPHRQLALESRYWASRVSHDAARIAASQRALDEYAAVLDMTEDYFLDTVRVVFREQRLARGTWEVGGQRVRGDALVDTALATVEGDRDDITGAGQTHAAHALCPRVPEAMRMRLSIRECDHYDLFSGPRWREEIHPALACFRRAVRHRVRQHRQSMAS